MRYVWLFGVLCLVMAACSGANTKRDADPVETTTPHRDSTIEGSPAVKVDLPTSAPIEELFTPLPGPSPTPVQALEASPSPSPFIQPYISPQNGPAYTQSDWVNFKPWELVTSVSWAPSGEYLAVSAGENIHLYKFPELELTKSLKVGAFTHSLAFSQEGAWLAAGSRDGKLRVWQWTSILASGQETVSPYLDIEAHRKGVNTVAFKPGGMLLSSGGNDAVVRFWDLHSGELMGEVVGGTFAVPSMAFTPDGSTLAIVNGDVVRLRDVASERIEGTFLSEVSLYSVALSPDGTRLAAGSDVNTIQIWDIESAYRTGQEVYPEPILLFSPNGEAGGYRGLIWQLAFSPNGSVLAAASGDSTIGLWRVDTGEFLGSLLGHTLGVTSVAFHPDGHFLASGGLDGSLRIWGVLE